MSTFDIEEPEEVWPVGIYENFETVKKNFLQGMKKSITETRGTNKRLNKLMATNSICFFSPQSLEFLDSVIGMQAALIEKKDRIKSARVASNSDNSVRLETLLNRKLHGIVKDTNKSSKKPEIEEMYQELMKLVSSMLKSQAEGPVPHEYSPRLEAALSRIAVFGLVTLDPSNNTVEFEL